VKSRVIVSWLFFLVASATALAQRLDGTLRGTVMDPARAVVSAADVTVTNQVTGVKESTKTTSTGEFVFPNLLVGMYTAEVAAPGFAKFVRREVEVLPNQVTVADASLVVGAPSTVVEVTGADVIQTTTAQLSNDFGARAVSDLPSPGLGGGPLNLALLAPNTTTQGAGVQGEGGSIGGARPRLTAGGDTVGLVWGTRSRALRSYSSRCTVLGEKAGRQTAIYCAPSGPGVL